MGCCFVKLLDDVALCLFVVDVSALGENGVQLGGHTREGCIDPGKVIGSKVEWKLDKSKRNSDSFIA
jgi:hypothetical protein